MTTLESVRFGNGSVTYITEVAPRPRTEVTERENEQTVHIVNEAQPGHPAYYEVSFMLSANFDNAGVKFSNVFHWECIVPEQSDSAQYHAVEDQAARKIAPMLRALADKIEAGLPDFPQKPHP